MISLFYDLLPAGAAQQEQHLAGRVLLRRVLGEGEVLLRENGKPFVSGAPEFSISHCKGLVLLGVNDRGYIGCDAERLDRIVRSPVRLRQRIAATPEEENMPLLELWVRKEAKYKAGGAGKVFLPEAPAGYVFAVCCPSLPDVLPQPERIALCL
ncbi:MAG: hypothetical protein LBQ33_04960 [Oscillospiraceae bacterium]|jgi:phosphopantetheinyl transferase|nr:hypothetical protein [Oscillospiraceae bacterium]